eukprot:TRINITY_DN1589_c0_g1_i2.p1 TRINITY_DN1589_c0_g1~~TRINITY_DN1589_c0_g1_i2.p1  ORF type:complete len:148 (+),score=35.62 TRINITY_DN1589_c0_g1_i2:500-943(+)
MHPRPRRILQLLRLRQIGDATFVQLNESTLKMLSLVEPYIAYGYPTLKTVKDLVYKRGFAKVENQRISILDNKIIEENMKKHNILCVEDIVHELFNVGPNFRQVSSFLWPFKLTAATRISKGVMTRFDGGSPGNRKEEINQLVQKMI